MQDGAILLEPYCEPQFDGRATKRVRIPRTDPPVMIPAINGDGSYYPIEKIDAHIMGLHHLAVSVFVFDGDELLIQRRAGVKYHCGGQWANTCCTHPHWNETVKTAATRRLKEELGFRVPITERLVVEYSADVGNGLWEKERVHMFRADVSRDAFELALDADEVSDVRWVTAPALRREIAATPDHFTPWFRIYLSQYPDLDF